MASSVPAITLSSDLIEPFLVCWVSSSLASFAKFFRAASLINSASTRWSSNVTLPWSVQLRIASESFRSLTAPFRKTTTVAAMLSCSFGNCDSQKSTVSSKRASLLGGSGTMPFVFVVDIELASDSLFWISIPHFNVRFYWVPTDI